MNIKLPLALLASFALSTTASAELIESDVTSLGDNKAVLDTTTGLEWLDLSETRLKGMRGSYSEVVSEIAAQNPDWRLATYSEISQMMNHYFLGKSSAEQDAMGAHFQAVFGKSSTFDQAYSIGLYEHPETGEYLSSGYRNKYGNYVVFDDTFNYYSSAKYYNGVYLVSDGGVTYSSLNNDNWNVAEGTTDVPLPVGTGLISLGLFGLTRRRR